MATLARQAARQVANLCQRRSFTTTQIRRSGHGPEPPYERSFDYFDTVHTPYRFMFFFTLFCASGSLIPVIGVRDQQRKAGGKV